jgi:predicted nucleic acid-binding protein
LKRVDNPILADTSVWVEFFKTNSKIGNTLEQLILENSIWICGIVLFELIQGVRSEDERSRILSIMLNLRYIEMTRPLWQKAGELASSLKKKGLNLPQSDIFIAAVAIDYNLSIFTLDKHFEQIPGVRIYKMQGTMPQAHS